MRRYFITLLLLSLPLTAWPADVYRSIDAQGHVKYSDTPSPGAVLVSTADVAISAGPGSEDAGSAKQAIAKAANEASEQVAQEEAQQAVEKDTAAAHEAQCKQAQDAYQKSITARRLYTVDANGNRQYMSDQQADAQRVQYRMAMQAACGDSDSQ